MKLDESMLGYIGNPRFCTIDEAIEYAIDADGINYFEEVMERVDMTLEKAIAFALRVDEPRVWKILVLREDLDSKKAHSFADEVNKPKVWGAFVTRRDVPFILAACKAQELGRFDVWQLVLNRGDATPNVVVDYALLVEDSLLWEAALTRKEVQTYIQTLPLVSILKIARSSKVSLVWNLVILKRVLIPQDILSFAIEAGDPIIFRQITLNNEVVSYLKTIYPAQAIEFAKELIHAEQLLSIILTRSDIKPAQIFSWLEHVSENVPDCNIFGRKDMKAYISRLSLKAAYDLSERIGYKKACKSMLLKEKVDAYLLTVPRKRILDIAAGAKDKCVAAMILSYERPDLPIKDVVKCALKINDKSIWNEVAKRPDFLEYFESMNDDKAISFAIGCDTPAIWMKLLAWRDFGPARIIELAKKANDFGVFNIIKLREDVVEYLKL